MEHLSVGPGSHLVDHRRLKVDEDSTRDVFAGAGLGEEGVEGVVRDADGLVGGHLAVGLDPMLEAVELPASVAHLATCLAHVDGDAFPLRIEDFINLDFLFRLIYSNDNEYECAMSLMK